MPVTRGLHDNWLYAQSVDHERCRIALHTVYPHVAPGAEPEWTDVIFEGVVVHHFQEQRCSAGPDPACVLFEVEESEPVAILRLYEDVLARSRNRGWPVLSYGDLEDLARRLCATGARCFQIQGVCGFEGFVFAASMTIQARAARADLGV